jgi:hypothetical protein
MGAQYGSAAQLGSLIRLHGPSSFASATCSPKALVSRNSLTFGARAANCDGSLILRAAPCHPARFLGKPCHPRKAMKKLSLGGKEVVGKIIEKVFTWFMILAFYAILAAPHVHAVWVALQ